MQFYQSNKKPDVDKEPLKYFSEQAVGVAVQQNQEKFTYSKQKLMSAPHRSLGKGNFILVS